MVTDSLNRIQFVANVMRFVKEVTPPFGRVFLLKIQALDPGLAMRSSEEMLNGHLRRICTK